MISDDELTATIDARVNALVAQGQGLDRPARESIRPPEPDASPVHNRPFELLREIADRSSAIELGRTLGAGGMGIVHAGQQKALGREVAVKTLREETYSEAAALQLLREAWTTGRLEHPNVVPVHEICLDARGRPQIVLKIIGGSAWSRLMQDADTVASEFHARDLLEWNLRILMQVCNAVHFAHSRGILHRDLKPDNVMIGEFGEVYVLDWGIAVSLRDDAEGRLQLARDAHELAGTPGYMAPEMLGSSSNLLSERTDVYLLGAILYEIITGHPPHRGNSLMEALKYIAASKPDLPSQTAPELAAIVRRAMRASPAARFESAEQLHNALADFLEHRGALKLTDEAEASLAQLDAERSAGSADPDQLRQRLYHLFGECRFGFQQSLRVWKDNARARAGLRRAITSMVELELELDDPKAAALLMGELDEAPPELLRRVTDAKHAREQEDARRAALAHDHDPSIGRRTRMFVGSLFGVIWTLVPWFAFRYDRSHRGALEHRTVALGSAVMLICGLAIWYWARTSLSRTVINRRLARTVAVALVAQLAFSLGAWAVDLDWQRSQPLVLLHYAVIATLAATSIEIGLWPAAVTFWITFMLACARPTFAFALTAVGNVGLTINIVSLWARMDEDVVTPLRESQEARLRKSRALLERLRQPQRRVDEGSEP